MSENLALARPCLYRLQSSQATNLTGFDPETNVITELFHPRRHAWEDHFHWRGSIYASVELRSSRQMRAGRQAGIDRRFT